MLQAAQRRQSSASPPGAAVPHARYRTRRWRVEQDVCRSHFEQDWEGGLRDIPHTQPALPSAMTEVFAQPRCIEILPSSDCIRSAVGRPLHTHYMQAARSTRTKGSYEIGSFFVLGEVEPALLRSMPPLLSPRSGEVRFLSPSILLV